MREEENHHRYRHSHHQMNRDERERKSKREKRDLEIDTRILEENKALFDDSELVNVERNLMNIEKERLRLQAAIDTPMAFTNLSRQQSETTTITSIFSPQTINLPITKYKDQIIKIIHKNQVVIIMGETGSGKTTQIPQFLIEAGYTQNDNKKIICTQPRRVAAISIASKVSRELGHPLGHEVGYSVRFEDYTSSKTILKYVTEGILLREIMTDPNLNSYSVVIIDEAHERTLNTDILLGLLKTIIRNNKKIKLVITSATMNVDKFSKYFDNAPALVIPGRQYPITTYYMNEDPDDFLVSCVKSIVQVHISPKTTGDILVFLPGQEEIETVEQMLIDLQNDKGNNPLLLSLCKLRLIIAPIYSAMPLELQHRVFNATPPGCRKIVLATNIAETSITIENIINVIDCGYSKQKIFSPRSGIESLVLGLCTRESADQRKGRAGRTAPGKCIRLYRKETMEEEMEHSLPEIVRSNLMGTILQLKSMGINNVDDFDFLDPPSMESISYATDMLFFLGCLSNEGIITKLGKSISELPLEPTLAKVLFASIKNECSLDVLKIISMLTVTDSFFLKGCRLLEEKDHEDDNQNINDNNDNGNDGNDNGNDEKDDMTGNEKQKTRVTIDEPSLFHPLGDHFVLLNLWNRWEEKEFDSSWCHDFYVNIKAMRASRNVFNQLLQLTKKLGIILVTSKSDVDIQKSFISGFFQNIATLEMRSSSSKKERGGGGRGGNPSNTTTYRVSRGGTQVTIHPKSVLSRLDSSLLPSLVLYHEIIETSRIFIHRVIKVDKELVDQAVPYYKYLK